MPRTSASKRYPIKWCKFKLHLSTSKRESICTAKKTIPHASTTKRIHLNGYQGKNFPDDFWREKFFAEELDKRWLDFYSLSEYLKLGFCRASLVWWRSRTTKTELPKEENPTRLVNSHYRPLVLWQAVWNLLEGSQRKLYHGWVQRVYFYFPRYSNSF